MEFTVIHAVICQCFIEVSYATAQPQPVRKRERIVFFDYFGKGRVGLSNVYI